MTEVDELVARAVELEHRHINRDGDDHHSILNVIEWWAIMLELWDLDRENWYVQAHYDMPVYRRKRGLVP